MFFSWYYLTLLCTLKYILTVTPGYPPLYSYLIAYGFFFKVRECPQGVSSSHLSVQCSLNLTYIKRGVTVGIYSTVHKRVKHYITDFKFAKFSCKKLSADIFDMQLIANLFYLTSVSSP